MRNQRWLILSQYYAPEMGAPQIRLRNFARELREAGIQVSVLTAMPNYPLGKIFDGYTGRFSVREEIDGVSMLSAGGDYDASLLLVDEIWSGDMLKVDGEIVVAVPARNVLLFVPAADEARVKELKALVRRVFAEYSYTLTDQLFIYRKGRFQRYSR